MVLHSTIGSKNIPEGAVRLTEKEALKYQNTIIGNWKNKSDVFFLSYGKHLACASVAFTSTITWNYFRVALQLRKGPGIFMALPATCLPVCITWFYFDKLVTNKVMLMRSKCPMCQQLTYGMFQVGQGLAYPFLTSVVSGGFLATHYKTYNVPDINLKKVITFFYSLAKPGALKFQAIAAFHLFVALLLPYLQTKELINLTNIVKNTEYDENL